VNIVKNIILVFGVEIGSEVERHVFIEDIISNVCGTGNELRPSAG